jgi:hypothetical protein
LLHHVYGSNAELGSPKDTTQIVKLKWLPSKKSKHGAEDGIWHGLFTLNVGVSNSSTTLQECSLTQEWVISALFSPAFRRECRDIATGRNSKQNPNKYLCIPAGDSHPNDDPEELVMEVSIHYQHIRGCPPLSCLRHSMSSAFHAMAFAEEAKDPPGITGRKYFGKHHRACRRCLPVCSKTVQGI